MNEVGPILFINYNYFQCIQRKLNFKLQNASNTINLLLQSIQHHLVNVYLIKAEFWNANHQILKKQFVVKKIKINHPNFQNISIDLDSDQIF